MLVHDNGSIRDSGNDIGSWGCGDGGDGTPYGTPYGR